MALGALFVRGLNSLVCVCVAMGSQHRVKMPLLFFVKVSVVYECCDDNCRAKWINPNEVCVGCDEC